jgi:hypothetical protein
MAKPTKRPKQPTSTSSIPPPFTTTPSSLEPLLTLLHPSNIYTTHIDRHPVDQKRNIFLVPVFLNLTIALILLWRVWAAAPVYYAIIQTFLGYTSSATVDLDHTTRQQQLWILFKRFAMFAADFLLFRFVGPWPLTFFAEQPVNPVTWRWKLGFKEEEVVVRVSRNWGQEELMKGLKRGEENAFFKTRILPAIERDQMAKTGYLMQNASWDLELQVMLSAHELVEAGKLSMKDLDKQVLVYQDGTGWLSWQWETDSDVVEGRRKKVVALKQKLTELGKESLFWRWMEIVEEERDGDGGFSVEGQKRVAERVSKAFEKEGVDFSEVEKSIGGLEEGLDGGKKAE